MSPQVSIGPVSSFVGIEQSRYPSVGKCNAIRVASRNAYLALHLGYCAAASVTRSTTFHSLVGIDHDGNDPDHSTDPRPGLSRGLNALTLLKDRKGRILQVPRLCM
jgi:hypothetical protein